MHSLSLRHKAVIHYRVFESSLRKVAKVYDVSKSSVARWVKNDVIDDSRRLVARHPKQKRHKRVASRIACSLRSELHRDPFLSASQLQQAILQTTQVKASLSTLARVRSELGFRFKCVKRSREHQPVDCSHPFLHAPDVYNDNAIAVDESSFVSVDHPSRGWAMGSATVPKPAPRNRKRVSLILAMNRNGVVSHELRNGSFSGKDFANFLCKLPKGSTVIADNASIHKTLEVREVAANHALTIAYTPPYSPWFNPVEFAFSVVKGTYRHVRVSRPSKNHCDDVRAAVTTKLVGSKCSSFFDHASAQRKKCIEGCQLGVG